MQQRRRVRRGARDAPGAAREARGAGAVAAKAHGAVVKASAVAVRADVLEATVHAHAAKAPAGVVSDKAKAAGPERRDGARDGGAVRSHPAPDRHGRLYRVRLRRQCAAAAADLREPPCPPRRPAR